MNTRRQVFTAIRWTAVAMVGRSALQFLQVAVLARLLLPSDFGLMALGAAILAFAQIFSDVGVSNAIIHHREVTDDQLSSLYWLNVAAGALLMVVLIVASPIIAQLYGKAQLVPLLVLASSYFLINAIGQQLRVLAEKNLAFEQLARIEIASALVGCTVAIGWALAAPTVLALVAGLLSSASTTTLLCWCLLSRGWRPKMRFRMNEIRPFLRFGGYAMANNVVNTFNTQADIFVGGHFLSAANLGAYSLPRDLSLRLAATVNPIVTRVGLPAMAMTQANPDSLKNIYLKSVWMTASVNFPLYAALIVFPADLVMVFFGSRWIDAVPILRILGLWGMIRSTGSPVGSLLFATGRADLAFKWNVGMLCLVPPALCAAAGFGAIGIAWTLVLIQIICFVPGWAALIRPTCGATLKEYVDTMSRPLVAASISAAAGAILHPALNASLLRLLCGLGLGASVYVLVSWFVNRDWLHAMVQLVMPAARER